MKKIPLPDIKKQKQIVKQAESGLFDGLRIETRLDYKEGFKQPTPAEVRLILKKLDLTGSKAGDLVGVSSRTVRKWTAENDKATIPYSAWKLLIKELEEKADS